MTPSATADGTAPGAKRAHPPWRLRAGRAASLAAAWLVLPTERVAAHGLPHPNGPLGTVLDVAQIALAVAFALFTAYTLYDRHGDNRDDGRDRPPAPGEDAPPERPNDVPHDRRRRPAGRETPPPAPPSSSSPS